jgi:hypothetical protein
LLKQLSKRLIEGALVGELKSHLEESDILFEEHAISLLLLWEVKIEEKA